MFSASNLVNLPRNFVRPDPGQGSEVCFNMDRISMVLLTVGGATHTIDFYNEGGTAVVLQIGYINDAAATAAYTALMAAIGAQDL